MHKKNIKLLIVGFLLVFGTFFVNFDSVSAEKCTSYGNKTEAICESHQENGYMCKWNSSAKGGGRCKKSRQPAPALKESVKSCTEIKSSNVCSNSIVDGKECIWRQGACYATEDDGTDKTIIAGSREERHSEEVKLDSITIDQITAAYSVTDADPGDTDCGLIPDSIIKFLNNLFLIIQVIGILLLVVLTIVEFVKVITTAAEDGLGGAIKNTFRRIIMVVLLLILRPLIMWILNLIDLSDCM